MNVLLSIQNNDTKMIKFQWNTAVNTLQKFISSEAKI